MPIPSHHTAAVTHGALYAAEDHVDPVIEIGEIDAPAFAAPWRVQIRLDRLDDVIAVLQEIRRRRMTTNPRSR